MTSPRDALPGSGQTEAADVRALPHPRPPHPLPGRRLRRDLPRGDIAEVRTREGKLHLFVGLDRTAELAITRLVEKADGRTAWEFLQHVLEAVPYQVHTILTPSRDITA